MNAHLCKNSQRSADLIFVLAGRENRKQHGLELFRKGLAPRILFSVSRFEIRRFSTLSLPIPLDLLKLAFDVPPPQRHFFVFFEGQRVGVEHVRPRRFGTLTEIESLANWLQSHPEIHSLLIISNDTHLRRIRMCCQSCLGAGFKIALMAAPEVSSRNRKSESTIAVLVEVLKGVLYWAILRLRRDRPRANHER
jgi:hypothetical protein